MTIDIHDILAPDGAIARRLDGFESRPQQVEMAALVGRAMDDRGHLLVEAGTGVGKSFAYLVPAIKRIVEHDERVVVVTNTINLQEQLVEKDIPLLNAVVPDEFSAVLVKGRGNYVSLRRLKLAIDRQDRLVADDDARHSLHLIEDWAYGTSDGSLATLPQLPRPAVWDYARSDAHNCMGRKCPTHKKCFYQAARRRMENGDLLVCNHALFFSDLALRAAGVGFLPKYDHVVLDEGHGVEEVAADHFGVSLAESRVVFLLRILYDPRRRRGFLGTLRLKDGSTALVDRAVEQTMQCRDGMEALFGALALWQSTSGSISGRIREAGVAENTLSAPMRELGNLLKALRDKAETEADEYELNSYATRAAEIADAAEVLLEQRLDGCVYFLEVHGGDAAAGRRRGRRMSLRAMAVDVAPILREHLFGAETSVVVTSATLTTTPNDFSHVTARLGCDGATAVQLGSPFAHARQMRVYVDPRMPSPNEPEYIERLVPAVEELVRHTDGGTFVLFTSFRMLDDVAGRLRPLLADDGHPVLVHGADGRPGLLLKRFRADHRSVLLGTTSFWQGVDVRGEGLRSVIITRLPFDVPDRPIVEARHERILAQGGHPFMDDQVPRAIIRFRQGIGRLIRSQSDRGIVTILDPRIVKKPYGRKFLAALPDGLEVEDVRALRE